MDKHVLVDTIEPFLTALSRHGWPVADFRVMPAYDKFRSFPLLLGIAIPAMVGKSIPERIRLTLPVMHESLSEAGQQLISGLLVYDSTTEMNMDMDEREGVGRPVVEPYWPD